MLGRPASGGMLACCLAMVACAQPAETSSQASAAPSEAVTPSVAASASPAVEAGRPYDAQDVLDAMRASRRPGGVADQLQTDAIASQVAEQLWTWDGMPWADLAMGGSCGAEACTLEVTGAPAAVSGSDTYTFSVDRTSGEVEVTATDLHGFPDDLGPRLDALARESLSASQLDGLTLLGARWLPPPNAGRYWLSYRSGGEEGSPGLDVLVDLPAGSVIETREPG